LLCAVASALLTVTAIADQTATSKRPNVLFIAIDDLRNDLGVFGAKHAITPNLDAFAATARPFRHHYVQVPTCGASRYSLLSGMRPRKSVHANNNAIQATSSEWANRSLPGLFRGAGYQTLALGKISHYPGGLTGKNWDAPPEEMPGVWDKQWIPDGPWPHAQAIMHGYANGVARIPGKSPPFEAVDGPDETYADAWIARDAGTTLGDLAKSDKPWLFAVGFFKPHLPFAAPKRYFDLHTENNHDLTPEESVKPTWPSGWHNSGEFFGNYRHEKNSNIITNPEYAYKMRRAYAASVSYVDAQVGKLIKALHDHGLDDNTIVVIWGDHGFLLGEHAIWGKHCLYEESLRSPLIIRYPGLVKPGEIASASVETIDIIPTLADLCKIEIPKSYDGQSLLPLLVDPAAAFAKPAIGYWQNRRTFRNDRWRLIVAGEGKEAELFDYQTDPRETRNVADEQPEKVAELLRTLDAIAPVLNK
jgi:iduronate 2-sulfatase